jgi:hypothetical protein
MELTQLFILGWLCLYCYVYGYQSVFVEFRHVFVLSFFFSFRPVLRGGNEGCLRDIHHARQKPQG